MLVDYLKPIEVPTLAVDLSEYMTAQELIKLADRVNEVREASFSAQCIDWTHATTCTTTTNGSYSTWAQPWAQSWDIDLERKYILNQAFDWDFCKPYVIFNDRKHKPKIDVTALLQLLIGEYQCL